MFIHGGTVALICGELPPLGPSASWGVLPRTKKESILLHKAPLVALLHSGGYSPLACTTVFLVDKTGFPVNKTCAVVYSNQLLITLCCKYAGGGAGTAPRVNNVMPSSSARTFASYNSL